MKMHIQKIQMLPDQISEEKMLEGLEIIGKQYSGRMATVTVRCSRQEAEARMRAGPPLYYENLPLSLEEIFIAETEVNGYDAKKLIL